MNSLLTKQLAFMACISFLNLGAVADANCGGDHHHGEKHTRARANLTGVRYSAVAFPMNKSTLSLEDKIALQNLVRDARSSDEGLNEITIVTWADQSAPALDQKLSKSQRELAESRANEIEIYLKQDLNARNVEVVSMAESEDNWFARNYDADDAELRSMYSMKGSDVPVTEREFQFLREEGGPSAAVVIAEKDMD